MTGDLLLELWRTHGDNIRRFQERGGRKGCLGWLHSRPWDSPRSPDAVGKWPSRWVLRLRSIQTTNCGECRSLRFWSGPIGCRPDGNQCLQRWCLPVSLSFSLVSHWAERLGWRMRWILRDLGIFLYGCVFGGKYIFVGRDVSQR